MYGLDDAPGCWKGTWRDRALKIGFRECLLDPCVYILDHVEEHGNAAIDGVIGLHVDDCVGGGRGSRWQKAWAQLQREFPFGKVMYGKAKFVGSELQQHDDFSVADELAAATGEPLQWSCR